MQCSRTGHEMPTFPQIPHQDPAAAWRWGSSGLLRGSNVMMKSERVMHLGKVWFVLQIVESKSRHIQYTKLTPNISIEERGAQGWTGGLVVFLSCALCLFAHPGKSSHWRRDWTQLHTFDLFAWLALFVRVLNNIFRYIQPLWSYISIISTHLNVFQLRCRGQRCCELTDGLVCLGARVVAQSSGAQMIHSAPQVLAQQTPEMSLCDLLFACAEQQ